MPENTPEMMLAAGRYEALAMSQHLLGIFLLLRPFLLVRFKTLRVLLLGLPWGGSLRQPLSLIYLLS
jgi:hypothetical protein